MSTMLDQLRELERLIVELGAKMGCLFEEPQDRFRPAPIDLEMDSHGANPTGATSAELCILGDSGETSSYNFGSCPRSSPMEASELSDRSLSRLEREILELPSRSFSSKASMEIPTEMEESTNKLTINLPQEPHTNNSFLEENSENLKKNHQSSGTSDSSLDGNPQEPRHSTMVEKDSAVVEKDFSVNDFGYPINGSSSNTKGHRNISNSLSNLPQETNDRGLSSLEVEFKGINSFSKINFPALNDKEVGKLADLLIKQTVAMDGFNSFAHTRIGVVLLRMGGMMDLWIDRIEIYMVDLGTVSMHYLSNSSAHNLFEEMPKRTTTIYSKGFVFDPGG